MFPSTSLFKERLETAQTLATNQVKCKCMLTVGIRDWRNFSNCRASRIIASGENCWAGTDGLVVLGASSRCLKIVEPASGSLVSADSFDSDFTPCSPILQLFVDRFASFVVPESRVGLEKSLAATVRESVTFVLRNFAGWFEIEGVESANMCKRDESRKNCRQKLSFVGRFASIVPTLIPIFFADAFRKSN